MRYVSSILKLMFLFTLNMLVEANTYVPVCREHRVRLGEQLWSRFCKGWIPCCKFPIRSALVKLNLIRAETKDQPARESHYLDCLAARFYTCSCSLSMFTSISLTSGRTLVHRSVALQSHAFFVLPSKWSAWLLCAYVVCTLVCFVCFDEIASLLQRS